MYTPNEVREMRFNKAVFGGYDVDDVNSAFASISDDYATLFKENTMLKKKLKVLADTVEEYRGVDEAMRKALINAQNMANEMVAEAERKSRDMLETATNEAKTKISELTAQIAAEEARLERAKAQTAEFMESIIKIFDVEREKFLTLKDEVKPASVEPAEQKAITDTAEEIAKSLEEKIRLEEEEAERRENARRAAAEAAKADEDAAADEGERVSEDTIPIDNKIPTEAEMDELEAEAEKPTRRIKPVFENLKFGTDYDIENED